MFELFIATVLVDGSQSETALNYPSMLEFERLHNCSILHTVDNNLHAKHLATLAWLAHKQSGIIVAATADDYAKHIKAISYRIEKVPFGEMVSTESSPT